MSDRQRPAVLHAGGVFVPASVCEPLWRALREQAARRQREDGVLLRADVAEVLDALRQAAAEHLAMSARGPVSRTSADIVPASPRDPDDVLTTADMASRLHVTERHVRRRARAAGIDPIARNAWRASDLPLIGAQQ